MNGTQYALCNRPQLSVPFSPFHSILYFIHYSQSESEHTEDTMKPPWLISSSQHNSFDEVQSHRDPTTRPDMQLERSSKK